MTHPQAQPIRVTDFQNIERITTSVLPTSNAQSIDQSNSHKNGKDSNGSGDTTDAGIQNGQNSKLNSPSMNKKSSDKRAITHTCQCYEIKTLLKIKVTGNLDDLTITCNGIKTAESIADLVDGYCRIVNNTEMSLWDRSYIRTPTSSAMNSLEKNHKYHHQQQQQQILSDSQQIMNSSSISNPSVSLQNSLRTESGNSLSNNSGGITTNASSSTNIEANMPFLSEDYVDIGVGEEDGKFCYETYACYVQFSFRQL